MNKETASSKILLSLIRINENNPRTITESDLEKLVNSLLCFPKMMKIRPIVVDGDFIALGGNMRTLALRKIEELGFEEACKRLNTLSTFVEKEDYQQEQIYSFWKEWYKKPYAHILQEENLTQEEKNEFIIKDNVGFGKWDFDMLANQWDSSKLNEWGMNVWDDDGKDWGELGYINEEQKEPELEKPIKIIIELSKEEQNNENVIRTLIQDVIKDFKGCEVK